MLGGTKEALYVIETDVVEERNLYGRRKKPPLVFIEMFYLYLMKKSIGFVRT